MSKRRAREQVEAEMAAEREALLEVRLLTTGYPRSHLTMHNHASPMPAVMLDLHRQNLANLNGACLLHRAAKKRSERAVRWRPRSRQRKMRCRCGCINCPLP